MTHNTSSTYQRKMINDEYVGNISFRSVFLFRFLSIRDLEKIPSHSAAERMVDTEVGAILKTG